MKRSARCRPVQIIRDSIHLIPREQMRESFVKKNDACGTLTNDTVYVSKSNLPGAGLGLFANCVFEVGQVVTAYGGLLEHADVVRKRAESDWSHTRRIPDSHFIYNGKFASLCFIPSDTDDKCVVNTKQKWDGITERLGEHTEEILGAADEFQQKIVTEGVGYMINHHPKQRNVSMVAESMDKNQLLPAYLFFIANKRIERDEEIFYLYNNKQSRSDFV